MKEKNKLIRVYTGTEITVNLLKGLLEEIGVPSTIQNNYKSGVEIGFVGGVQSAIDVTKANMREGTIILLLFQPRSRHFFISDYQNNFSAVLKNISLPDLIIIPIF